MNHGSVTQVSLANQNLEWTRLSDRVLPGPGFGSVPLLRKSNVVLAALVGSAVKRPWTHLAAAPW